MAVKQQDSGTATLEAPKTQGAGSGGGPNPSAVSASAPPPEKRQVPEVVPSKIPTDVMLGDDVYYVETAGQHAGVINPTIKAAKVSGVGINGALTLHVFGRMGWQIVVGAWRDEETKKPQTWHKRPERT